ncbi:MAG: antitoxin VapB family protein [Luteolibacter sp.]
MKTITLDDAAYSKLKSWKRNNSESFSSVVKRVVPEPGSLGAFLAFVERRGTAHREGNEILNHVVETSRTSAKTDPWT